MDDLEELCLSKNTKILYNLLEVRIFDLSQALQVAGYKLQINQLKQNLEKQYNIFGQFEKIFHQLNVHKLYELMKQVSQNYISIASILIDEKIASMNAKYKNMQVKMEENVQKQDSNWNKNEDQKDKGSQRIQKRMKTMRKVNKQQKMTQNVAKQCIDAVLNQSSINHKKMGGINLFNENYVRGIQSLQDKWEAIEAKNKKHYNQKQIIKELIFKEMTQQVEVQKIHDNDEISKFIKQGKVKHELYNHIDYEKDLESISIFLKQSQDDALKFLTETKKDNSEVENEDDIIINYHELIEILAEKKKKEFNVIENKIKEIVDTFKNKVDYLDTQIQIKQANIRELQYKLKRKQGKQISTQTLGLRNNLNSNSASSIEDIEQQHKAIIQMLRKNIDNTQKQLINLEADVRVKDQRIKKKDTEILALETQIQKYKKNLKEEKQKTSQIIRQKSSTKNTNLAKQLQKRQDSQKTDQASLYGHEGDKDDVMKKNQRRKNKMMSGNYSTSIISASSKYRKDRQDSVLSLGSGQISQKNRRMNSFNSSSNSISNGFNQTGLQYHINQISKGYEFRQNDRQDATSTQGQEGRKLSTVLSSGGANQTMINQGKHNFTQDQLSIIQKNAPKENQITNGSNINEKYTFQAQIGQNISQITSGEKDMNIIGVFQKQFGTKKNQKLTKKSIQSKNRNRVFDNTLSYPKDPEFIFSAQSLLKKNAQVLYDALFGSVDSVDGQPFIVEDEIKKLKEFMSRYNQRQVQSRLRRVVSFLNLSQHTERIEEKQVFEEEDTVSNCSKQLKNQNEINLKLFNRQQQLAIEFLNDNHKPNLRMRQIKTEADKGEKDHKSVDLQTLKDRKLKKQLPSSTFLKKLHAHIRISGKGFNISKQEFIDLCKNITVDQSHLTSQRSSISISDSQDESHRQSVNKPTIQNNYKNKDSLITQNAPKQKNDDHKNSRILNVEGNTIQGKIKEKGQNKHHKNKTNENLENQSKIPKSYKFTITKEIQHEIRSIIPAVTSNSSTQFILDKKRQIKDFYSILKSQGAKIDSLQKFQEVMELSKISLEDIIKISKSLRSQKFQDIMNLFSHKCEKSNNKSNQKSFQIEACCLHARRYEAFLQKLSITENSVRKMKKDLLNIHIFNIDGNESQKQIYQKKINKQKSAKMLDTTNLLQSKQVANNKTGQSDSFQVKKRKKEKTNQKRIGQKQQQTKKTTVSTYIEAKQKTDTEIGRQNERKSVGNFNIKSSVTGFLPQLATKRMSQLIRE